MKLIIAGGREFDDREYLFNVLNDLWRPTLRDITVLSGKARGADSIGEDWARVWDYPVKEYHAAWNILGKKAGFMRNLEMAIDGDVLVAFWDGFSKGTKHMIDAALREGLEVHVYPYEGDKE